jgi:hypothetical protein
MFLSSIIGLIELTECGLFIHLLHGAAPAARQQHIRVDIAMARSTGDHRLWNMPCCRDHRRVVVTGWSAGDLSTAFVKAR